MDIDYLWLKIVFGFTALFSLLFAMYKLFLKYYRSRIEKIHQESQTASNIVDKIFTSVKDRLPEFSDSSIAEDNSNESKASSYKETDLTSRALVRTLLSSVNDGRSKENVLQEGILNLLASKPDTVKSEDGKEKIIVPLEALALVNRYLNPMVSEDGEILISMKSDPVVSDIEKVVIHIKESNDILYKSDEELIEHVRNIYLLNKKTGLPLSQLTKLYTEYGADIDQVLENISSKPIHTDNNKETDDENKKLKQANMEQNDLNENVGGEAVSSKNGSKNNRGGSRNRAQKKDIAVHDKLETGETMQEEDFDLSSEDQSTHFSESLKNEDNVINKDMSSIISADDLLNSDGEIVAEGFDQDALIGISDLSDLEKDFENISEKKIQVSDEQKDTTLTLNDFDQDIENSKENNTAIQSNDKNDVDQDEFIKEKIAKKPWSTLPSDVFFDNKLTRFASFVKNLVNEHDDFYDIFFANVVKHEPIIFADNKEEFFVPFPIIISAFAHMFGNDSKEVLDIIQKGMSKSQTLKNKIKNGFAEILKPYAYRQGNVFGRYCFEKDGLLSGEYGVWIKTSTLKKAFDREEDYDYYVSFPLNNGYILSKGENGNCEKNMIKPRDSIVVSI